jgi:hypothetical protein
MEAAYVKQAGFEQEQTHFTRGIARARTPVRSAQQG